MGPLLGIITLIGWGTGDIFGAVASRKIGSYQTTFYQFLIGTIVCSLLLPYFWQDSIGITIPLLLLNIFLGTFYVFANVLANEGFKQSNASVVGVVMQSFPAVVLVLSHFIFKDPVTTSQLIFIILIFMGVLLCSLNLGELFGQKFVIDLGIKYAVSAMIIWAIYFTLFRLFSDQYGWFLPNYISFLTLPLAMFLANKWLHLSDHPTLVKDWKLLGIISLSSFLIRGGDISLNIGLSMGYSSITAPIAGASPVLFALTSALVFKDKITKQQVVGIIFALLGISGLAFRF